MITRIKAARSVLGLALTCFELILAFSFFVKIIGEEHIFSWFWEDVGEFSYGASNLSLDKNIESPTKFLIVVLAFMLFGFVMIMIIPQVVEKTEKEMGDDWDEEII